MVDDREVYVIRQSESGDYWLVPIKFADQFIDDEFDGVADYATYIGDLNELQIYDFEV